MFSSLNSILLPLQPACPLGTIESSFLMQRKLDGGETFKLINTQNIRSSFTFYSVRIFRHSHNRTATNWFIASVTHAFEMEKKANQRTNGTAGLTQHRHTAQTTRDDRLEKNPRGKTSEKEWICSHLGRDSPEDWMSRESKLRQEREPLIVVLSVCLKEFSACLRVRGASWCHHPPPRCCSGLR